MAQGQTVYLNTSTEEDLRTVAGDGAKILLRRGVEIDRLALGHVRLLSIVGVAHPTAERRSRS